MHLTKPLKIIIGIIVCEVAGMIGSIFTTPAIGTWYATLNQPTFAPPNWVFAPVWTTLFLLMGVAVGLVWAKLANTPQPPSKGGNTRDIKIGLWLFGVQLVLNVLWSVIFFGMHSPGLALIEIVILWLAIILTKIYFYQISRPAAYLLLPYLLWVSFAGCLNFMFWILN